MAAVLAALGAGLASMAFRGAGGEGEPTDAYAAGRVAELGELRRRLMELVDAEGADAFEASLEVMEAAVATLRLVAVGTKAVPEPRRGACQAAGSTLLAAVEAAGSAADATGAPGADLALARRSLADEAARLRAEVSA